jgi:uncharacterized membrane protein
MSDLSKVITWRIISLLVGIVITYIYLGEIRQSLELTLIFTFIMTTLHFYFEKWWSFRKSRISGKKESAV